MTDPRYALHFKQGLDLTPEISLAMKRLHQRHALGPLEVVATDPITAAHDLCLISQERTFTHVHLVNAYTISLAANSPEYLATLQSNAINLPDGKPLSWFSKIAGQDPSIRQVRGPQLFLNVFEASQKIGVKHFLLGSTGDVLALLQSQLHARFPYAQIVGIESPPFRPMTAAEQKAQDERIVQSGADIVWIGLGTPKQDYEASRLASTTGLTTIAIGAAFDFTAGTVKEAPEWISKIGFEWLFRLLTEPRRLWRRYLIGNFTFVKALIERQFNWKE